MRFFFTLLFIFLCSLFSSSSLSSVFISLWFGFVYVYACVHITSSFCCVLLLKLFFHALLNDTTKKKLFCPFLCCNSIRCHMKRHEKILFSRSTNFFYEWTHYSMFNDSLELVQDFIFWQIMKIKILKISCWIFLWKFFSFWGWICYDENTHASLSFSWTWKMFFFFVDWE